MEFRFRGGVGPGRPAGLRRECGPAAERGDQAVLAGPKGTRRSSTATPKAPSIPYKSRGVYTFTLVTLAPLRHASLGEFGSPQARVRRPNFHHCESDRT